MEWFLPCLYAFLGCGAFCFIFELRRWWYILSAAISGAVGWFVYLSLSDLTDVSRYLLATIAVAVLSEIFARLYKTPATVFLIIGIIPLVPGGGIYYAMGYCLEGDTEQFLSALLGTLGMAAALAGGVILASSLFRAVFPRLARVPKRMPSGRQNP